MKAVIIYESLTGHTRTAAALIAKELNAAGVDAVACPITQIDYQALSEADLLIVGTWTDGLVFVGQRPGRASRLRNLPLVDGKRTFVFCTYAINAGKVLDKMTAILSARGADVLGGMAIRRDDIPGGARDFVHRLVDSVEA
jgi:hypothetical protein